MHGRDVAIGLVGRKKVDLHMDVKKNRNMEWSMVTLLHREKNVNTDIKLWEVIRAKITP